MEQNKKPTRKDVSIILLYDQQKKILMQHRTKDAPRFPDHWGFFGGSIEKGENPKEAILREVLEELNYIIKNPKQVMVTIYKDKECKGKRHIFAEQYRMGEKLELQEGQGMAWFTLEEARKLKVSPHNTVVLGRLSEDKFS